MEFIYQKESNLDNENNFKIEISEKKIMQKMKKLLEEMNIFLLSLDLKLKDEGIVK